MPHDHDVMPSTDWWMHDPLQYSPDAKVLAEEYWPAYTRFIRERGITSVVEFGVRAGNSMAAMLRGNPRLTYLGIDNDSGDHGGIPGSLAHAEVLRERYAEGEALFWVTDSHLITELPRRFDLGYIDGDHSTVGCLHDLELCAAWCDLILVDDVDHLASVRAAVTQFCEARGLIPEIIHNYAGWAIITIQGTLAL